MRVEERNLIDNVREYLMELGCSIVQTEQRNKNLIADMVGYVIDQAGELKAQVVVEITSTMNPNKQRQIFTMAKSFESKYALLVINGEEISKYWFDVETSLPIAEPTFKSFSKYLVKYQDIEDATFRLYDTFETSYRPFENVKTILSVLILRRYLEEKLILDNWLNLTKLDLEELLEDTYKFYNLENISNLKELNKHQISNLLEISNKLPPRYKKYHKTILSLVERNNIREIGDFATSKKLNEIISKTVASLGKNELIALDLGSGFGVNMLDIANEVSIKEYTGIEINQEIINIANILKLICDLNNINFSLEDALKMDKGINYDLVTMEPPMGTIVNSTEYQGFSVTNSTRRKIDYQDLFIEKAIQLTCPKGYIVTVVTEGLLFSSSSKTIREHILSETIVRGVISLPERIKSPYTGVKLSILVLQKKDKDLNSANEFFAGKIDSVDEADIVIEAFKNWIGGY